MKQRTLAMMTGFERYTKKTRRAVFLEEMEQVVPWLELCSLIEPHYPQAAMGDLEEALYDSLVMRQFVSIDLGQEPVPDETTVCKFRHLLEEHNLGGAMLETVNLHLESQGVKITTGTIVDATIIHAPTSSKNRDQQRDPEMHQTKRARTGISA